MAAHVALTVLGTDIERRSRPRSCDVPLLGDTVAASDPGTQGDAAFVVVCEAEFGLVGIPADRIIEITKSDKVKAGEGAAGPSGSENNTNISCDYRQLDLNAILEDPEFSMCGLKD